MRVAALVLIGLGVSSTALAQTAATTVQSSPYTLEIRARRYVEGSRMTGSAGDAGVTKVEGYVSLDEALCSMASGPTEPRSTPGVGWHFVADVTGVVRRAGGDQWIVRIDWARLWEGGRKLQAPMQSREVTIRAGERVELDRVLPAGTSPCGAVEVKLEAALVATPAYLMTTARGVGAGVVGSGVSGGRGAVAGSARGTGAGATGVQSGSGSSAGVSAGTGRSTPITSGGRGGRGSASGVGAGTTTSGVAGGVRGGRGSASGVGAGTTTSGVAGGRGSTNVTSGVAGGVRGGRGSGVSSAGAGGGVVGAGRGTTQNLRVTLSGSYEAELWLVHRGPDGRESVQAQTIRFGGAAKDYSFPPVRIQTSRGEVTLDITGKLQVVPLNYSDMDRPAGNFVVLVKPQPSGETQANVRINLAITRRARATGAPILDMTGGSSVVIDVPSPTDVLSFELPPLQKETEDLLKGHVFSLRVRIKGS